MCKPFDWIDEFPAVATFSPDQEHHYQMATSLHELSFGCVDSRARNSYAESMMAIICASGGFDEYCHPAGSL